eukprot:1138848-Pyramimonas_sp.AAC.1
MVAVVAVAVAVAVAAVGCAPTMRNFCWASLTANRCIVQALFLEGEVFTTTTAPARCALTMHSSRAGLPHD